MSLLWTCKTHIQIKICPTVTAPKIWWHFSKKKNVIRKWVSALLPLMQEGWGLHMLHITYHSRITYSTWSWKLISLPLTSHILVIIVISFCKFKPLINLQSFLANLWPRCIIITSYKLRKFHMSPCLLKYSLTFTPSISTTDTSSESQW